jgi:hypothetical protein
MHDMKVDQNNNLEIRAKAVTILLTKRFALTESLAKPRVVITSKYFDPDNLYVEVLSFFTSFLLLFTLKLMPVPFHQDERTGVRVDRYLEGELMNNYIYGCRIVITNISSVHHKLEVLMQIPQGALPVSNGFYHKTDFVEVTFPICSPSLMK